jgi:hypothetical protein
MSGGWLNLLKGILTSYGYKATINISEIDVLCLIPTTYDMN